MVIQREESHTFLPIVSKALRIVLLCCVVSGAYAATRRALILTLGWNNNMKPFGMNSRLRLMIHICKLWSFIVVSCSKQICCSTNLGCAFFSRFHSVGVVCFTLFLTRLQFAKSIFRYRNNSEKITLNRILRIDSTQLNSKIQSSDMALKLNNKALKKQTFDFCFLFFSFLVNFQIENQTFYILQ